ncbi:hypothetical protein GCM10022631_32160 [Deinococcus rubellus]
MLRLGLPAPEARAGPLPGRLPALGSSHLAALIGVADTGSFSEAALRLGVAQSTVSQAVQAAEKELGVRLFERGRHGAFLTPAGRRVLEQARLAAAALRGMTLAGDPAGGGSSGVLSGPLHVVSCRSVIRHFLTPALGGFQRRYPQAQVILHDTSGEHDDIERMVASGEADLGLGRLPMRPDLCSQPLFADEYLIVAAAGQLRLKTWNAFHRAAYIVCEEDCAPYIAAHIALHSRPPAPAVRLKDAQVALGMVAEGHGFTVLTSSVVWPLPPGLQAYSLPTPLWRWIGSVATMQASRHPLVQAFQDAVLSPAALRTLAGPLAGSLRFAGVASPLSAAQRVGSP